MSDDKSDPYTDWPFAPPVQPPAREVLFEFVRESDRKHVRIELLFRGESYGWEVQTFEGGEFIRSRGAFTLRASALVWAQQERKDLVKG